MLKMKDMIKRISKIVCAMFVTIMNMSLPVHAANNVSVEKEILYSYHRVNTT